MTPTDLISLLRDWAPGIFLVTLALIWGMAETVAAKRQPDIEADVEELLDSLHNIDDMMSAQHDYLLHEVARYRSAVETAAAMTKSTDPDLSASLLKLIK